MSIRQLSTAFLGLVAAGSCLAAPPAYRIELIDKSNGIKSEYVAGISDNGNIAGCGHDSRSDATVAYLKKSGKKMQALAGSAGYCEPGDVNDAGEVVARYVRDNTVQAALWTRDGTLHDLRELAGCDALLSDEYSNLGAINRAGHVAFSLKCHLNGKPYNGGALWHDGQLTRLPAPGGGFVEVTDVNNVGQVVGWSTSRKGESGIIWERDGTARALPPLGDSNSAGPRAINDAGHIVGTVTFPTGPNRGFHFDGVSMNELPMCGKYRPYPVDINNDGLIVAGYGGGQNNRHTALIQEGQCFALEDLLDASGGDWEDLSVRGVNSHGVMVGYGHYRGVGRNWIATPIVR